MCYRKQYHLIQATLYTKSIMKLSLEPDYMESNDLESMFTLALQLTETKENHTVANGPDSES